MNSYSQLGQDLWILEKTNNKIGGFFLDVGAYDGMHISNTYLLETEFDWNGVCVEPSSIYNQLSTNRKCQTDRICVYSKSNENIEFHETILNMELSGIKTSFRYDEHTETRKHHKTYSVSTISLTDLCIKYNCPSYIDYLSLDTEGSELEILLYHNFDLYKFGYITIEHNKDKTYKQEIQEFLESKKYVLDNSARFIDIQNNDSLYFEDWYILKA